MAVKIWNMELELQSVAEAKDANIPMPFIEKVKSELKNLGNFTLESTLLDVIHSSALEEKRYHLSEQTENNSGDAGSNRDYNRDTDEEIIAQVSELIDKENDPDLAVERSYDEEIMELQSRYSRKIAPHKLYLPISECERSAIGFYCMQANFDPQIKHLLHFLFLKQSENVIEFNGSILVDILDDFDTGIFDAYSLSNLIHEKEFYGKTENNNQEYHTEFPKDVESLLKFIKTALVNNAATNRESSPESTVKAPVPVNLTYFELNAKQEYMKSFKLELEHAGYIAKGLPLDVFRRVFIFKDDYLKDKLKQQSCIPIDWLVNKSHLGYLVKQLSKHNVIIEKDYYKIAENCFLFKGNPIPNTVFHGMQLPAINVKRKLDRIALLLVDKSHK
jgi:hypothetical protein